MVLFLLSVIYVLLGAHKGHAEQGDVQYDAFVVVESLQNKKGFVIF